MQSSYHNQKGFTLMEIVVATAIFAGTVTLMLDLFGTALKTNRRVQALRQVTQGTRTFTEVLTRQIRNGRIDYQSTNVNCASSNYASANNQSLAIINASEEKICFYYSASDQSVYMSKTSGSATFVEAINPSNFTIKATTFRFIVRPSTNAKPSGPPYPGVQPVVTITAEFMVSLNATETPTTIPYQTTISTDVYDIPHT